jgi:predicted chitinase
VLPLADLVENPDLALDPGVSARILAKYIKREYKCIAGALEKQDYLKARKAVNGGSNGMDHFCEAYFKGVKLVLPSDRLPNAWA